MRSGNGYYSGLTKLEKYLGHKNFSFSDIDIDFIKDYENYMYTKLGNKSTSVLFSFNTIKIFFNYAINEDVIDVARARPACFKGKIKRGEYFDCDFSSRADR